MLVKSCEEAVETNEARSFSGSNGESGSDSGSAVHPCESGWENRGRIDPADRGRGVIPPKAVLKEAGEEDWA